MPDESQTAATSSSGWALTIARCERPILPMPTTAIRITRVVVVTAEERTVDRCSSANRRKSVPLARVARVMASGYRERTRSKLAGGAVSALVAAGCAVANSGIVGGFPPKPRLDNLQI